MGRTPSEGAADAKKAPAKRRSTVKDLRRPARCAALPVSLCRRHCYSSANEGAVSTSRPREEST
ncbi:hypothetical protein J2R99_000087 [Rhodopseudomonas julia]|uniref:Uncharacterized protein n=1 Tax=Rhodopseudomonas julia TaxID=200617 RepID=A0ABU0C144_9BRAD|nr:hypothetical protein [Rhodopseudomonas julia]